MDKIAGAHTAARGADCGGDAESGAEPLREGAERVEAGQGELAETRDDAGHPQDLFGRTGGEAPRGTTGRIRVHGDEVGVKIVCFRADDGLSVRAGNVVKTMRLPRIDLSNLEVAHAVVAVALTEVGVPPVSRRTAHERKTLHLDDEDVGAVNAVRAERAGNRRCHRLARLSGDALLERGDVGQADGDEVVVLVQAEDDETALGHVPEGAESRAKRGAALPGRLHLDRRGVPASPPQSRNECEKVKTVRHTVTLTAIL